MSFTEELRRLICANHPTETSIINTSFSNIGSSKCGLEVVLEYVKQILIAEAIDEYIKEERKE